MKFLTKEKSRGHGLFAGLHPTPHSNNKMRSKIFTYLLCLLIAFTATQLKAQNITIRYTDADIEDVFRAIKKQSGYQFLYTKSMLKGARKVSIDIKAKPLQATLNDLFKDQPFTFEILDRTIVVKERRPQAKQQSAIDIKGTVLDDQDKPLVGATIRLMGSGTGVQTGNNGEFTLKNVNAGETVQIAYVGYTPVQLPATAEMGNIKMFTAVGQLNTVEVSVSTGYQTLPKERATGSFTQIDNKTLNRNVGINILDRLESVASGLLLNRNLPTQGGANNAKISIHGRSTLFASPDPLIILDGFPYEGNLDQINPADIENITVLKDAAAASIWGTRAGNGVVVITSKNGKKDQPLSININSTVTVGNKPDQYYIPQISSSDFIDLETFMFSKGYYNSDINSQYSPISPAVELLKQRRNNQINDTELNEKLNILRTYDIRSDLEKYYYRPSVYQQYQLNLNGGGSNNWYYLSAGYDKNLQNTVTDKYDRLTLTARNTYAFLNGKLKISADLNFNTGNTFSRYDPYRPFTPYDHLTDSNGNAESVVTTSTLSNSYTDVAGGGKLLDWKYRPINEFTPNSQRKYTQSKINGTVHFNIIKGLDFIGTYQYLNEASDIERNNALNSFFTRNLINTYSSISNNTVSRVIPLGDIQYEANIKTISKIGRAQLNFSRTFGINHEINAIAGFEGSDYRRSSSDRTLYGYDPSTKNNQNDAISPLTPYPYFYDPIFTQFIYTAPGSGERINIGQSLYANASYSFKQRYIFSASARQDKSNLFGVNTNQKGVPLWSAGLAWVVNKEDFYQVTWLPSLKLRATYGYSGNVDKSVSGLLTSSQAGNNEWSSPFATIINPPNPDLRWEQVKNYNIGIDFSFKNNRVTGSLDFYQKDGFDLIGNSAIAMQSGIKQYRGNNANLRTKGIDLLLNTRNLTGIFKWDTGLLFNYNSDKVTSYKTKQSSNANIVNLNFGNPLEGFPYYAVFSLPSAGLDNTGRPQGYLNGSVSKTYGSILNQFAPDQITYHGSASPKYFGSILNTFSFKNIELSLNLVYKLDYYFRRTRVFNSRFTNSYQTMIDYDKRWQKPGDELTTNIPALFYPAVSSLNSFFTVSDVLVERGDHIRLQDIRLSYSLPSKVVNRLPFKTVSAFAYAKNLGILWRKNKQGIDPDYLTGTMREPISFSFGLNLNL